ncbi:hypothetical protein RFI_00522 [Reticulomyxa filosa]|uniref:Nudix hydrolase domain-containing protein n=1 Tax=Reticulomyxa filosa TaxID=46433 RepID=X6PDH2_RETFI|nr:hypothetical protein RFI_00522 [Reticulomyxa filosa]|eukprot:ETO36540.1 hypothetical protein RFI_00522 [Reticulomyxa filosa]
MSRLDKKSLLPRLCIFSAVSFILYKLYEQRDKDGRHIKQVSSDSLRTEEANEFEIKEDEDKENEKIWKSDTNMLAFQSDHFRGIRVIASRIPKNKKEWEQKLSYSLREWTLKKFRGVWIKLPVALVSYLEYGLKQGMAIHHATKEYVMLYKWLPHDEKDMVPEYCHSYLGVGALIINEKRQCVVIQEKWDFGRANYWKTPGGAVDRCESISHAAVREAKVKWKMCLLFVVCFLEETGIECEFISILGFRQMMPYRFGNTADIWFLCLLRPVDNTPLEFKKDEHEIAQIKWMDLNEFMNLECTKSIFQHYNFEKAVAKEVDWLLKHWNDCFDQQPKNLDNSLKIVKNTNIGFRCLPLEDRSTEHKQKRYFFQPNTQL